MQLGFTLVEIMVVLSLVGIITISFGSFFFNYSKLYANYQTDGSNFTELASQSQRISDVLRGITDINTESANDLDAYAYFAPTDTYVSDVHYYLNSAQTAVMVDITPLTANPPNGIPITSKKKTYTIITNYYKQAGLSLFSYYDASANALTPPVADEHTITEIGVNLAEPASHSSKGQQLNIVVSLRNRKTNL
jgi:prepilin-type N-terminal cleavage/methylation domain-containing protein